MINNVQNVNTKTPNNTESKPNFRLKDGLFIAGTSFAAAGLTGGVTYHNKSVKMDETSKKLAKAAQNLHSFLSANSTTKKITTGPYYDLYNWITKINKDPAGVGLNSLLFKGEDKDKIEKMIDAFGELSQQNYIKINCHQPTKEEIAAAKAANKPVPINKNNVFLNLQKLKDLKTVYENTGKWNFVYLKNMDALLQPKTSTYDMRAFMKGFLEDVSKHYYTTIIFDTSADFSAFDKDMLSSSRVNQIFNADELGNFDEFKETLKKMITEKNNLEEIKKSKLPTVKKNFAKAFGIGLIASSTLVLIKKIKDKKSNNKEIKNETGK